MALLQRGLYVGCLLGILLLSACSSPPKVKPVIQEQSKTAPASVVSVPVAKPSTSTAPALPKANSGRGGYYLDDGPGDDIPEGLESTVDPIPVVEPYSRTGNKPYKVFGKNYTPINDSTTPFKQKGFASWYGKKFHGKRTSSGEPYDMYKVTAAHPTLPIPSYARVTNLSNGKQIIVRINDRGPFHSNRIMDLSYTAALKLGYLSKGSSEVELERLLPEDIAKMAENSQNQQAQITPASPNAVKNDTKPVSEKGSDKTEKEGVSLEALIASQGRIIKTELPRSEEKSNTVADQSKSQNLFYLQFAAFAIRANAETGKTQLMQVLKDKQRQLGTEQEINLEIVQQGSLYRLQGGPYMQREAAQKAAQDLAVGSAKPIVIQR
ncbi:septal ring lytic transglycosylase RlpA family protein [Undibacterium sp.]|uniref:septal ring lytic transglycosylase RlpA family protein n=1 Tax=Undibacterium sp. TaxID=1914977 RepID=UPI003750F202